MPSAASNRGGPLARQGHRRRIAAAMVCAAGIGAALAALLSSSDAQFLTRVGSRHLGTAFALSSALAIGLMWKVGTLADRRDRAGLLWLGSWVAAAFVVLLALTSAVFPKLAAVALLVASKQIGGALELLLWVVIADRFTARQARRVLPWVVVSHGAGGALGALAVGPVARALGAMAPIWLAAGLLVLVGLSASYFMRSLDFRVTRAALTQSRADESSTIRVLRERPLARWLALLVASAGIFAPMMYYLLGVSAAAEYKGEVELAGFLGNYRAYVQGAVLLTQLAIAPRLSQRLGVGFMLLLAPAGALIAAVTVGLNGALLAILLAQAATRILDSAIQSPAEQLVQNLLPQEVRGRVAGIVGGIAKRSGTVVGGLAASTLIIWPSAFASALFGAAALWLLMATLLWQRFANLAVAELSSSTAASAQVSGEAARELGEERGLRQLRTLLASDNARERDNALALLSRLTELGKVNAIDELLQVMASAEVQKKSLEQAIWLRLGSGELASEQGLAQALALVQSKIPSELHLGFAILSTQGSSLSDEVKHQVKILAQGQGSISAAVAVLRLELASVLDELLTAGHDALVVHELRCEIARSLRGQSVDAPEDLAERLLRSLARCPEPALQVAGLDSVIAAIGEPGANAMGMLVRARLVELAARWRSSSMAALREASLLAMVAGGEVDLRVLVHALGDREDAVRRQADRLLREAGDAALGALSLASQSGRRRIRLAAVELLADLRPSDEALDALVAQELDEMARCSHHARALAALPSSKLVCRRLEERVHEAVEAALMALEARSSKRGKGAAIGEVARRLARAASERSKARALEALDALLPRRIANTMLGAMEGRLTGEVSLQLAVQAEISGRDPLTRDLLVQALGREGRASFRESIAEAATAAAQAIDPVQLVERLIAGESAKVVNDVPGLLETIVALSELPLFADLSTLQLEELARVVSWQRVARGETVMHQGDEGHCMYFVRAGQLEVLLEGHKVATLGVGEPVGELALFAQDRRTATVVAAEDCELGVLSREDIENLVEEVPGIALQLCRAMSRRLAEQNRSSSAC